MGRTRHGYEMAVPDAYTFAPCSYTRFELIHGDEIPSCLKTKRVDFGFRILVPGLFWIYNGWVEGLLGSARITMQNCNNVPVLYTYVIDGPLCHGCVSVQGRKKMQIKHTFEIKFEFKVAYTPGQTFGFHRRDDPPPPPPLNNTQFILGTIHLAGESRNWTGIENDHFGDTN